MVIPTYIVNLKGRTERKENILNEFDGKPEFNVTIVEAIKHEVGAVGLWKTIKHILRDLIKKEYEYILICEDDHEFTKDYSKEMLLENIIKAKIYRADILCGGVSWVNNIVEVQDGMFWVEKFSGLQFTIIFRNLFEKCLNADFHLSDAADYKICELSMNKYFMFPFASIQKDYGYSDATSKNNSGGKVRELFKKCIDTVNIVKKVSNYYSNKGITDLSLTLDGFENVTIPTYVINTFRAKRANITEQFEGRYEFDVTLFDAIEQDIEPICKWSSIRKIVEMAMEKDEDVIIISEDDHEFTSDYSKDYLFQNIIESFEQGIDMLIGGVIDMNAAVPIAANRFWVSRFNGTQFLIIFKKMFQLLINEPYDITVKTNEKLSEIVVNKAVLFPFVSIQNAFRFSNVSPTYNACHIPEPKEEKFQECIARFQRIKDIRKSSLC